MKPYIGIILSAVVLSSCFPDLTKSGVHKSHEERWDLMREYMADGAAASNERPYDGVMSEQEVLLKAADYAIKDGVLDPSYYRYKNHPALLTAKIETPILIYDTDGYPGVYQLAAVDETGHMLMYAFVSLDPDVPADDVVNTIFVSTVPEYDEQCGHLITKREAKEIIASQFPGQKTTEPIAVLGLILEGRPHSNMQTFWYFTVEDNPRSVDGSIEEYIMAAHVAVNKSVLKSNRGRSLAMTEYEGNPHLGWERMARLDTPLLLKDKVQAVSRLSRAAMKSREYHLREQLKFTPVPAR